MNRLLYILLISVVTIIGFSMYKQNDLGHISFSFASFSFETNLLVFGAATLSCLFVILVIFKTYQAVINLLLSFSKKRKQRLAAKARFSLTQGVIEYAEGRFEHAEKVLLQHIEHSENKLLIYLTAARAAQQLGAHERRDEYLAKAHLESPEANTAICLTKAELQLAHNQNEQALATLTQINKHSPNHTYVLTLLANTYQHLQDWSNLQDILPALKKHGQLSTESFLRFEIAVCNGQLSSLTKQTHQQDPQFLISYWNSVSQNLKNLPEVDRKSVV